MKTKDGAINFQQYFPQALTLKEKNQSYLDSAATTLKPHCVIETLKQFYEEQVANIHRGDHFLSQELTTKYEQVRTQVQAWIQASSSQEIIFTKSCTEGLNFLAHGLADHFQAGDEILLTEMEHHSNLLPWQALAKKRGLQLKFLPLNNKGELLISQWEQLVTPKTKLCSFVYYSNALGTRNPVEQLLAQAKSHGMLTILDAAQAMTVEPVNVQKNGCDFLVFSGHKLFAPEGVGILYINKKHLNKLPPYQLGGGMVHEVSKTSSTWADPPHCFEAGTPAIGAVLALGVVLQFLKNINYFDTVKTHTTQLLYQAEEELKKIPNLQIIAPSPSRASILSFILKSVHCHDLGQLISQSGVAVRSGHHCCLPLMEALGLDSGTVRVSFAAYNDEQDVRSLITAVKKAQRLLA